MSDDSPTPYQEAAARIRETWAKDGALFMLCANCHEPIPTDTAGAEMHWDHCPSTRQREALIAERDALQAENRVLQGRIDAVKALHFNVMGACSQCYSGEGDEIDWPCPTVRALTGGETP